LAQKLLNNIAGDVYEKKLRILVINPGSTSTAIALFEDDKLMEKGTIRYSSKELAKGKIFINWIKERIKFIALVISVCPETDEMEDLALGTIQSIEILKGEEEALEYK
jgi:butyrate kinase